MKQKQIPDSIYSARSYRRAEHGAARPDRDTLVRILTDGLGERDPNRINRILELAKYDKLSDQQVAEMTSTPEPQLARWGPVEGKPAGLLINSINGPFIPWDILKKEIEVRLLRQIWNVPAESTVALNEFRGRKDWIVRVLNPAGKEVANVWFGSDPKLGWKWDGLVRIGEVKSHDLPPMVWQVFQRYSDGSYRRITTYD